MRQRQREFGGRYGRLNQDLASAGPASAQHAAARGRPQVRGRGQRWTKPHCGPGTACRAWTSVSRWASPGAAQPGPPSSARGAECHVLASATCVYACACESKSSTPGPEGPWGGLSFHPLPPQPRKNKTLKIPKPLCCSREGKDTGERGAAGLHRSSSLRLRAGSFSPSSSA